MLDRQPFHILDDLPDGFSLLGDQGLQDLGLLVDFIVHEGHVRSPPASLPSCRGEGIVANVQG